MIVLGSTGSIGINTLKIAKKFDIKIDVLVAGSNYELLNQQIKEFNPKRVVVATKEIANKINHDNVSYSQDSIIDAILESKSDIVVNAIVGEAGLKPTLATIKSNKKLALANKESLVIAGKFIDTKNIVPIDSEHFGLWYLINGRKIKRLNITASGGALRDYPLDKVYNASLEEVLKHPNWDMGVKITIDSATMVNKLFEILEAMWLFDNKNIDAIIETSSTIHSFIDFIDGSTTAHIANTDMKLPIAFAILDEVKEEIIPTIDLLKISKLEFREIDTNRYPVWKIKNILLQNPDLGVVINTINEIAIKKFLNKEIKFGDISKMILDNVKKYHDIKIANIDEIFEIQTKLKKENDARVCK